MSLLVSDKLISLFSLSLSGERDLCEELKGLISDGEGEFEGVCGPITIGNLCASFECNP